MTIVQLLADKMIVKKTATLLVILTYIIGYYFPLAKIELALDVLYHV